ncbi:hypothetical protein BDZ45DRAFT_753320 [Acephala macrosclerotiorum]|nr:hypothetical protein BDZ45DRAFT_753320 [Acephala macrosclerotiorum]
MLSEPQNSQIQSWPSESYDTVTLLETSPPPARPIVNLPMPPRQTSPSTAHFQHQAREISSTQEKTHAQQSQMLMAQAPSPQAAPPRDGTPVPPPLLPTFRPRIRVETQPQYLYRYSSHQPQALYSHQPHIQTPTTHPPSPSLSLRPDTPVPPPALPGRYYQAINWIFTRYTEEFPGAVPTVRGQAMIRALIDGELLELEKIRYEFMKLLNAGRERESFVVFAERMLTRWEEKKGNGAGNGNGV